jgi:hypothetical protein
MPQDYGRIMGSMADTVAAPLNAFTRNYNAGQVIGQRNEELAQREQVRNALIQQQQQEQQQQVDTEEKASDLAKKAVEAFGDGTNGAEDRALPYLLEMARYDEAGTGLLSRHFQQKLAEIEASKPPSPIQAQQVGGATFYTQDGKNIASQLPPQPQQYGPESFSPQTLGDGSIVLVGNRGTIRKTDLKGQVKGGEVGGMGASLNDRQRSGLGMQRDNALAYAANLTKTPLAEVKKIYEASGPAGVATLMKTKGKRGIQGATARVLQDLPFGQTIVDANNADLLAPAFGGGAGIALMQNPTGPVANADFAAGRMQFPNATYPLETQAGMVEQLLKSSDEPAQGGAPTFATEAEAAAAGLQPGTRVVIGGVPGTWQ